jgi:hypothetical protein
MHHYLLRALVSCGHCQLACTARTENARNGYYVCNGKGQSVHPHRACTGYFAYPVLYENSVRHFANAHYSFGVNCNQMGFSYSTATRMQIWWSPSSVALTASGEPHETHRSIEKATPMLGDQLLYC